MLTSIILIIVIGAILTLFWKVITADDKKDSYEYGKLKLREQKEVERQTALYLFREINK